jgi:hypothetical protein
LTKCNASEACTAELELQTIISGSPVNRRASHFQSHPDITAALQGTASEVRRLLQMIQGAASSVRIAAWLVVFITACSAEAGRWALYADEQGTRIEYPAHIFQTESPGEGGVGRNYRTSDGRAQLHMYSMANPKRLSPAAYMRAHFPGPRSSLSYDRVAKSFFAVSTRRNGMIVYVRCNFSQIKGGTLHCVEMKYPAVEKREWDAIVTRVSRSVRPLH